MADQGQKNERRKTARYRAPGGCVVLASACSPHSFQLGDILDISTTGVALRYVGDEKLSEGVFELTIIYCKHHVCLAALPSKTVSSIEINNKNGRRLPTRRWSLEFGELTAEQRLGIKDFITKRVAVEV